MIRYDTIRYDTIKNKTDKNYFTVSCSSIILYILGKSIYNITNFTIYNVKNLMDKSPDPNQSKQKY